MRQYLEQRMYESIQESENLRVYQVGDLESLSASALYSPGPSGPIKPLGSGPLRPIGSISGFEPAINFGLGPGIVQQNLGFLERYRAGKHEDYGKDHVNLDIISPITGIHLLDLHLDMKDD